MHLAKKEQRILDQNDKTFQKSIGSPLVPFYSKTHYKIRATTFNAVRGAGAVGTRKFFGATEREWRRHSGGDGWGRISQGVGRKERILYWPRRWWRDYGLGYHS